MFEPNERAIGGFIPQDTRDSEYHATGVGTLAEEFTRGLKGRHLTNRTKERKET